MTNAIDSLFAWLLLVVGFAGIWFTELRHPAGPVLDTPFLWILAAMFNLLRLGNGYRLEGLKSFCIAANLVVLVAETVRLKMFGPFVLIQGIPILAETIFSIVRKNDASCA